MRRWLGLVLVFAAACLNASCGGGASSDGGRESIGAIKADGTFTLMFSGGSVPGVKHAWLTVYQFAVHEDKNRPWDPTDRSWQVVPLRNPVTIDLTLKTGFVFGSGNDGLPVAPGTYNQIRLFFKAPDDVTPPVAKNADGVPLAYKAQLEYDDGSFVPIEIPNIYSGLKLDRGVTISSGKLSLLTSALDVKHSIVRFDGGGAVDSVTFRPRTYTYALNAQRTTNYIGRLDPSLVCGTKVSNGVFVANNCASDISVSLFGPSGDGLRMESWGEVRVNPLTAEGETDASFLIGPVTYVEYVDQQDGQTKFDNPRQYDLMIRGKGMRTMLVRNIPVEQLLTEIGCSWSANATGGATVKALIRPVIDPAPQENVTLRTVPLAFRSGRVGLGFELAGTDSKGDLYSRFYEAHSAHTDPFLLGLTNGSRLTLPGVSNGNMGVEVIDYSGISDYCKSVTSASANTVYPVPFVTQSVTGYRPFSVDTFYTDAKLAESPTFDYVGGIDFDVQAPTSYPGLSLTSGTALVSISNLPTTGYDKAWLVVSDVGGIVLTKDISNLLSAGGTLESPISVSLPSVPVGVDTNGDATGVYEFAVRYWSSSAPAGMKWVRSSNFVNFRNGVTSGAVAMTATR